LTNKYVNRKKFVPDNPLELRAFIPGTIVKLYVNEGDKVLRDSELLILEAMKMHNHVRTFHDYRIKKIHIKEGDMVAKGQLLLEYES
jgi:pyruvate carboxylase